MTNDPIEVIIVDDEHLIRSLLKRCIDWNSIGMDIVGEASSGEDAIELVETHHPDLIFTDICMTNIDGIDFADCVIKNHPKLKIVIISGYDDFKYAQRSIRAGISDYLLKPIDDEVLLATAIKMKKEIEAERESNSEFDILKKQYIENLPFLKERFFNRLLHKDKEIAEIRDQMKYINLNFNYDYFQVAVVEIIFNLQSNSIKKGDEINFNNQTLVKIREFLAQYEDIHIYFDNYYRIIILSNNEDEILEALLVDVKQNILKDLMNSYCIGIGTFEKTMENIEKSYKKALEALNYRIILGKNSIINYSSIELQSIENEDRSIKVDDKLKIYFLSGATEEIFKKNEAIYKHPINIIKEYAFSYVTALFDMLSEMNLQLEELSVNKYSLYKEIFEIDNIPDLKNFINDVTLKTVDIINSHKRRKSNKLIDDITEYLKLNLSDSELSLTKVAQVFFINPSYLSRVFKKEVEINFMEYLTKVRIHRAMLLLNNEDLMGYEVAEMVGIPDSSYFSTCFKKYTGISISEYKKVNQKKVKISNT